MQADFQFGDQTPFDSKYGLKSSYGNNCNNNNDKKNYKVAEKQHGHNSSVFYHSGHPTRRLGSPNRLPSPSDNLPGSSMSVADITLTMSNDAYGCQMTSSFPFDSGLEEDKSGSSLLSPIPLCNNQTCNAKVCTLHKWILKNPQYVTWQPKILPVTLTRSVKDKPFGFLLKVKEHTLGGVKKEKEIYVLVKKVESNSQAHLEGLAVGDFVRSVNHEPIDTLERFNNMIDCTLKNKKEMKMQIQRPEVFQPKAAPSSEDSMLLPPQSPSTSPDVRCLSKLRHGEAIPMQVVPRPKTQTCLPQARLIVCGNRTNEFMRSFMTGLVNFPTDSHPTYHHVAMETIGQIHNSVEISNAEAFSVMAKESNHHCVNVDVVSIANDNFFHHCCPWIFHPDSVFIITFDVNRLAHFSEVEMARLSNLKHTVQTSGSWSPNQIKLVGVTLPGEEVPYEEIRTLFYTSRGESLSLSVPDFVVVSGNTTQEMHLFLSQVFQCLREISTRRQVLLSTLNVLDCLISHQNFAINNHELVSSLMDSSLGSDLKSLSCIKLELRQTGNLIIMNDNSTNPGTVQDFIIPSKLFDHLVKVTIATDRPQLPQSGIFPRSDFVTYLSDFTSQPDKLLVCLEQLKVIFTIAVKFSDNGMSEESGILFPFFLEESVPFDPVNEGIHELLDIHISNPIPSSAYFFWLSRLSRHSQRFKMIGQGMSAKVSLEGLSLSCVWDISHNNIKIFTKRPNTNVPHALQRVERILSLSLGEALPCAFHLQWVDNFTRATQPALGPRSKAAAITTAVANQSGVTQPLSSYEKLHQYRQGSNIFNVEDRMIPNIEVVVTTEDKEMLNWLLNRAIETIPYISISLEKIIKQLTMDEEWETLAKNIPTVTTSNIRLYKAIIRNNPDRLSAETFYKHFTQETSCTLADFLSALMMMGPENLICGHLAEELLQEAWNGFQCHRDKHQN